MVSPPVIRGTRFFLEMGKRDWPLLTPVFFYDLAIFGSVVVTLVTRFRDRSAARRWHTSPERAMLDQIVAAPWYMNVQGFGPFM
jgi:hypothetical protein